MFQEYTGLKHADDKHDAFWLAEMLRLGILPEDYLYPKEERPLRDLLRKRGHLVSLRTSLIISLQNIIRTCGIRLNVDEAKRLREDRVTPLLAQNEAIRLACAVSKESIDFLTRQIKSIEKRGEIALTFPLMPCIHLDSRKRKLSQNLLRPVRASPF